MGDAADDIWTFYRRCAAVRQRVQDAALRAVPVPKVLEHARRLGLPVDGELAQVPEADLAFAFDLAVHTAPPGRSRAIERAVRQQLRSADGEAALVLRALETAWFSVFRATGPHPEAGLLAEDVLLGGEVWLVDEGLAETAPPGALFAARVGRVRGFAVTCGTVASLDEAVLAGFRRVLAAEEVPAADLVADARFATLLYRRALGFEVGDLLQPP